MKSTSNGLAKPKGKQRRVSLGDGLVRLDRPGGTSSWVCRVQKDGVRRDFGLGSCQKVSLAQARELAQEIREQVEIGIDPHFERRQRQAVPTFIEAAAKTYEIHSKTWRSGKHHAQWTRTLELYAFPHIGKFKVDQINGPMIRDLLAEIWLAKPETARRVRQCVGAVLDWAYASGYRETDAPMRAITKGLPRQPRRDNHFAATSWLPRMIFNNEVLDAFGGLKWWFREFEPEDGRLLLSDLPLYWDGGFTKPGFYIYVPIAPNRLFIGTRAEETEAILSQIPSAKLIERVNRASIASASQRIWASSREDAHILIESNLGIMGMDAVAMATLALRQADENQ